MKAVNEVPRYLNFKIFYYKDRVAHALNLIGKIDISSDNLPTY